MIIAFNVIKECSKTAYKILHKVQGVGIFVYLLIQYSIEEIINIISSKYILIAKVIYKKNCRILKNIYFLNT